MFIPDELVPILEEAIRKSPSETLVFADENGKQWRHDTNLTRTLGDALRKADVVTGYRYHCRRKGCGHKETRPEKLALRCPKCNFKLLVIGIPKKMRWYDLRHSCATLHRLAGADPLAVKVALGHARVDPTDDIYTHLTPAFQRRELNKLRLFEAPEPPAPKNGGGEGESLTSTKNESLLFRAEPQTSIRNESVSMSSNTAMGMDAGEHPTAGLLSRGSGVRAPRDSSPWLSTKQAAEESGLAAEYFRDAVNAGRLRASRFGTRIRIARADFDEFMRRGNPGPTVGGAS